MKKSFNILLGSALVAGLLIGCGGSSDSDDKEPTTPPVDVRQCTAAATKAQFDLGYKLDDGKKIADVVAVTLKDGKGAMLNDLNVTGFEAIKFDAVATYPLVVTSPSCDNNMTVEVKVAEKAPSANSLKKPVLPGY